MAAAVRHPIFARVFDRLCPTMEREVGPHRDELVAGLHGRVVEIGAGNGANFARYPATVAEVLALEPEPYLRERAADAARTAPVPVRVRDGVAEEIPLEDASVDAAVVSLVLCSVHDPARAAAELQRVVRPGGEVRFFEHVRAASPGKARLQRALDRSRLWPGVAGGCHCARDTVATLEAAGLTIEEQRSVDVGPAWSHTNPHVIGRARRA